MSNAEIAVEQLQAFLISEVPSFREECLAGRVLMAECDNYYLLLQDFYNHLSGLYRKAEALESFTRALSATDALLKRGAPDVRDAAVIQVVDRMIRDGGLRIAASQSGLATLTRTIADQASNWQEWRERQPTSHSLDQSVD